MQGGIKKGVAPRASVWTDKGGAWQVAQTALEVQEMQELAMAADRPWVLMEMTIASHEGGNNWAGKRVFIRADAITAVSPPMDPADNGEEE